MLKPEDEFTVIDDFPVMSGSLSSLPSSTNLEMHSPVSVNAEQKFFISNIDKISLSHSFLTERLANYEFAGRGNGFGPAMINICMLSMGIQYVFNTRQEVLGFRRGNCFFTCTQDVMFAGTAVFPYTFQGLNTDISPTNGPGMPSSQFWNEITWIIVPTSNEAMPRAHVALMIGVKQGNNSYSFHLYDSKNYSWGTSDAMQRALNYLQTQLQIRCIYGGKSLLGKQQMFAYGHGWAIDRKCSLHVSALAYFFSRIDKYALTPNIVDNSAGIIFEIVNGLPDHILPVVIQLGYAEDELTKPGNDHLRLKYLSALTVMNHLLDYTQRDATHPAVGLYPSEMKMGICPVVQNTAKVLVPLMQRLIKHPYAYLMLVFLYSHMISNTDPNGARAQHIREFMAVYYR